MSILVRVLAVVACLVVVGAIAFFILRSTSLFTITSIEAVGSDHVSVEDIQNLIGVEEGTTLLNVDTNAIEANLKKNPWVESVDIEREFPDKLKVTVHERSVFAVVVMSSRSVVWYLGEGCVWIEPATLTVAEGQTTDDAALELANSVGAILITNVPSTVDPVAGSEATDDVIVAVNEYLDGFTDDFASQIVSFDTPSTDSISCVLSSGVEISLGSPTNISAKQTVIEELLARYPNQLTYINVRVPSNPSYRKIDSDSVQAGSGALSSDGSDETTSSSDSTTSESTTDQTTSSDSTSTSSDSTSDSSSSDQSTSSDQSSSE